MSNPLVMAKDLADNVVCVAAAGASTATAGGAGNNVAVIGLAIDRENLLPSGAGAAVANAVPIGAMFLVRYDATLGANNTVTIKNALVQDSADGVNWATIYDQTGATAPIPPTWPAGGVVDTGQTGGSTQHGVVVFGTDIQKARRYVRFQFTPQLSAASADTVTTNAVAVLSGYGEKPPQAAYI